MTQIYQYRGGGTGPGGSSNVSTPVLFSATAVSDSVGVNIHVGYDSSSYANYDRLLAKLQELKITYARDGLNKVLTTSKVNGWKKLKDAGIHLLQTVGRPIESTFNTYATGESAKLIRALKATAGTTTSDGYTGLNGLYSAIMGPNEWSEEGGSWVSELNAWTNEYYDAVKADPALANVPFYAPSITGPNVNYYNYTNTKSDALCPHTYRGGRTPEVSTSNANLVPVITAARSVSTTQPIIITETGYHNAVNTESGHRPVPEDIAGHYIVREIIFNLMKGVTRSYFYQLFDERPNNPEQDNPESWFGLFAVQGSDSDSPSTWTLRRKPAGDAILNLKNELVDNGSNPIPANIPLSVTVGPGNMYVCPIGRKDGKYQIAIGTTNSLWNQDTNATIADVTSSATIEFASNVNVDSSQPSVSATKSRIATATKTLTVPINGKTKILTISAS